MAEDRDDLETLSDLERRDASIPYGLEARTTKFGRITRGEWAYF